MKKLFALITILFLYSTIIKAQTKTPAKVDTIKKTDSIKVNASTDRTEKFKKNDTAYNKLTFDNSYLQINDSADLKLPNCDFEKGANAMILTDWATVNFIGPNITMVRYKRIKIFNDNGKSEANIRIDYNNQFGAEHILAVVAQTLNFVNGKIVRTKLDSSLIYNIHTDKQKDAITFSMPNVKAGSVIEYCYAWIRTEARSIPDWYFQSKLPTRYSEANIMLSSFVRYTQLTYTIQPFVKDTISSMGYGHVYAMKNIPSAKDEPFMRSATDGLERVSLIITSSLGYNQSAQNIANSWQAIGKQLLNYKEFNKPFDQNINDAENLVTTAKALKTQDEKIEFLFNQVRTLMNINDDRNWVSKDGIKSAWKRKIGSPAEINMVLCHLLKQCGIKAYPLLVSTRDNGLMYTSFPNVYQINKLVTYIPVDSTKNYVLDASDKYNLYNEIPFELLNSAGLCINKEKDSCYMVTMHTDDPVRKRIAIEAEIKPDATVTGTAEIFDYRYNKSSWIELHKTLDEKKYEEYLTNNDNNLKISSLKFDNADVDSLPLLQTVNFKLDLSATDDNYIYFSPNLFASLQNNPFLSTTRATDIDFGFKSVVNISGRYKMPDGYKTYILPKNLTIVTPDKSITFKRIVNENGGYIIVYYVINYNQAIYQKGDYPSLYAFFKKMYEMLNEQIVLKKT